MDMNLLPKSQRKLESKDLPSVRRLGKGLSGFIYETTWDGNKYARKDFPLRSVKHVIFEKEVSVLLDLDQPNVVKCFGYTVGRSSCSLLQEYVDDDLQNTMQKRIEAHRKKNSTSTLRSRVLAVDDMKSLLLSKVKERDSIRVDEGSSRLLGSGGTIPFEMSEAVKIISQIATGMKYLHDNQVAHGDLKTKNVLVCSESGETKVKVTDFGLTETKKMIKLVSKRSQHFEILMWKAPERLEELLGPITEDSDDPFTDSDTEEDVTFGSHNEENFKFLAMADVYSFGLTCSHILGGKLLFPGLSLTQLRKQKIHGFKPELPTDCPEYLKFMISSCLQIEPLSRPTFSAICTRFSRSKALLSHNPEFMLLMEGSTSSLEQMKPMPQVLRALEIIENVQKLSGDVRVNKHQCKLVADRFKAIGVGLNLDFFGGSHKSNSMDYPAFDELLTVLRKGEFLVKKNDQPGSWEVLIQKDNREAFKEIHEALDTMKAKFPFEGFSTYFETTSGIQRSLLLTQDAEKDLEEMKGLIVINPSFQVPKALEIIKNVQEISSTVWVNKHQCQRLAARFKAIGEGLGCDFFGGSNGNHNMDYPAFDELLTVLRKGQVLVSNNTQWAGIKGVLIRSDNREAFEEINEELDTMKAKFPFEGFSRGFETTSGIQRSQILAQDADKDLEEMKGLSRIEESRQATDKPEAMDLKKVEKVVLEKSQPASDVLPSYLKIDRSTIIINDPVLEILSNLDSQETHGMAIVCEGSWLGCEFAVKVIKSDKSDLNRNQLLKEVGSLMELRHPHIIRFIGFARDAQLCLVLMEMMPEKDLRHFMKHHPGQAGRPFTRSQELDIITQIAKGMYYLHMQGYVHGALACSNILVKKYEDYIEVKIGDLRYAQKMESAGGSSEMNLVRQPRWTALEIVKDYLDLLKQADVYSFAMTCYEVVTGKLPFLDVQGHAFFEHVKAGVRPELPADLDSGLKGLIESCWNNDPNMRPVFEDICVVLDFIRFSKPTFTNKSSGIGKVWNAGWNFLRQIPKVQGLHNGWLGGVRDRAQPEEPSPSQFTTWTGNAEYGSGRREGANTDAIKVPERLKIKPATLKIVRKIGSGSSAKVYEVTWLGCTFALKRIWKLENAASISELQHELHFLIQLRHPYIIQMVGFSVDERERCSIVMEFMHRSLRDLIDSRLRKKRTHTKTNASQPVVLFEFHEAVGIITKLAQGMAFLHSRGVMHRDLKGTNVLCQEHAGCSIDVKIVDFGVSQHIAASKANATLGVGTGFWRAPEIFPTAVNRSRKSDVNLMAADVYSFAMTCYEILTGFVPFQEFGFSISKYDEVVKGLRPTLPPDLDPGLKEVITDSWHADPEQRPSFVHICTRLNTLLHY